MNKDKITEIFVQIDDFTQLPPIKGRLIFAVSVILLTGLPEGKSIGVG